MPRAATSVATQTRARPSRNACSAWVRSFWVNSPDSATTEKPRSDKRRLQMPHRLARVAEHQRARRFEEAQDVDDGMLDVAGRDPDGAIFDVGMTAFVAADLDAKRLLLIFLGQRHDHARQRRREQQRAAGFRRGLEDEFHVLAKAEIEHFVGLVEHDGLQFRNVETVAPQMIAQPARRADHDVGAGGEFALLAARIHAADAGNHARIGIAIEPGEFAMDLQRQFARRRDDQGQRCGRPLEPFGIAEQFVGDRQPIGDGLAGAGLRRDQQIAAGGVVGQHGGLHRRQRIVSCARPELGRAADLWSGMSRGSDLYWRYAPETLNNASNQTVEAAVAVGCAGHLARRN